MQIKDWGEDHLIDWVKTHFPPPPHHIGIGDDCAVLPHTEHTSLLWTTDALVEGIHFLRTTIDPYELGIKSIAVNVSDLAAMGGTAHSALLSLALPATLPQSWVTSFLSGVQKGCQSYSLFLLGGDTVGSLHDILINISMLGSASTVHLKFRHHGQPGDWICVTGTIGDSAAGLKLLQSGASEALDPVQRSLIDRHRLPRAHQAEGIWLGQQPHVHAMMDLSDGLHLDLQKMLAASHCGAEIELTALPVSTELVAVAQRHDWDCEQLAVSGGEDYVLLCSVAPDAFEELDATYKSIFSTPLYKIGKLTDRPGQLTYQRLGSRASLRLDLFDHFKNPAPDSDDGAESPDAL